MSSEGSASMTDDSEENESPEKKVQHGGVGEGQRGIDEGQSSSKVDKLKVNGVGIDSKYGVVSGLQGQVVMQVHHCHQQQQQQQCQGKAFRWERFLHIRSIKVLLVENDDSTRHIVMALLRNCNYEVIEASNGLQAWKILEDLTNHVDLVLSEVVMPCLSGIGLLWKIMSYNMRKNIPVIMMSSHDSMGLVFKCLSKGAVDFLVKPIRKNELKNLWQHVWRRCHSSSGSGSESGTQTQKSVKPKSSVKSENNSGSNDGEYNGANIGDGGDYGSGTQNSWPKKPIEVGRSQVVSPVDQVAGCRDSTIAQVIRSDAEISANKWVQMTATRKCQEEQQPENAADGNGSLAGETVNLEANPENSNKVPFKHIDAEQNLLLEIDPVDCRNKIGKGHEFSGDCPSNKNKVVCTTTSGPQTESKKFDGSRELVNRRNEKNNVSNDSKEPVIGLSLKRLKGVQDNLKDVQDDHIVLRHSELSAFSRYNAFSRAFRAPNGVTGSSSAIRHSPELAEKESIFDIRNHSNENSLYPKSTGVSNIINKLSTSPLIFLSDEISTVSGLHNSSPFKPVKNDRRCNTQQMTLVKPSDMQADISVAPARSSQQDLQIQQPHHHHHYHLNHFHNFENIYMMSNNDELSLTKLDVDASHFVSANVLGLPSGENPINSLNTSASGSNYGSNGHNGSSSAANAGGTSGESHTGMPLQSLSADAIGSGSGNSKDQNRLAQREAALTKFLQKRKERCFKKKVRYQNRKRLAEMRPRVRGQFIRKTEIEKSNNDPDE